MEMFVSPARLTEVDLTAHIGDVSAQHPAQAQVEDLVNAAKVPESIQNGSILDKLNSDIRMSIGIMKWCVVSLSGKCLEEMEKRMDFDSDLFGQLLSQPGALTLLQYCLYTLESHSSRCAVPDMEVASLIHSVSWPPASNFVKMSILCSFSLFRPSVAIPCILQLYHPASSLDSLLSYLSPYFSTILSVNLHSKLDQILSSSKTNPKASDTFALLSVLTHILAIPRVFESVVKHWTGSSQGSDSDSKLENLSSWLLDISDLAISSSNGTDLGILPLIIDNCDLSNASLLANVLIATGRRPNNGNEHPIFEMVTSHFFKALTSHINGLPDATITLIQKISYWPNIEQAIPPKILQKWRNFEIVSSQYHSNDNPPDPRLESIRQNIIIAKAKLSFPVHGFSTETIQHLFKSLPTQNHLLISRQNAFNVEKRPSSIESCSFNEIGNMLKHVLTLAKKSRFSDFFSLIPFDWLLSLVDQAPFEIVYLAHSLLEMCLEYSSPIKLHLFASQLLDYFESLSLATSSTSRTAHHTNLPPNHNSMDVDNPTTSLEDSEAIKSQLLSLSDKLHLIRSLILKMKSQRAVSTALIAEIVSRLCTGDLSKVQHALVPSFAFDPRPTSSSTSHISSKSLLGVETLEEMSPHEVLGNVRKRAREAIHSAETPSSTSLSSTSAYLRGSTIKRTSIMANNELSPHFSNQSSFLRPGFSLTHPSVKRDIHAIDALQPRVELFALLENFALSTISSSTAASIAPKVSSSAGITPHKGPVGSGASIATDMLPKVAEILVAQVDNKFPPIVNYEVYFEILPKKSVYDRDRQVEQLFLQRPILWSVLELVSTRSSLLHSCRHIILSLLVNLIGSWNAEADTTPASQSFWFSRTLVLMRIIEACPSFGVGSTKQIAGIHVIFEYCLASDVAIILTGLFHFIAKRLANPVITSPLSATDDRSWVLKPIRFVLRRNILILSEKALDVYNRTSVPSKPS